MAINELRSITTFIKAAELGSLRKAALELGISPQAASKALAQLEAHLDARLFHRTTRVMSLTDAGQRLFEDVQPSVLGMQRALQTARSAKDEFAGPLRIAGPRTTFQPILWATRRSTSLSYRPSAATTSCSNCKPSWQAGC